MQNIRETLLPIHSLTQSDFLDGSIDGAYYSLRFTIRYGGMAQKSASSDSVFPQNCEKRYSGEASRFFGYNRL